MVATMTHEPNTRNAIASAVLVDIDAGTGAAYLRFETAGDAEVATCTFPDPAGTVTGAVLNFDVDPDISDTTPAGGTIEHASIYDSDANKILECNVAVTGASINISSITIATGDTVTLTSLTYTAPT